MAYFKDGAGILQEDLRPTVTGIRIVSSWNMNRVPYFPNTNLDRRDESAC